MSTGLEILLLGVVLGIFIGVPTGMIYEDLTDTIKIRDKKRDNNV